MAEAVKFISAFPMEFVIVLVTERGDIWQYEPKTKTWTAISTRPVEAESKWLNAVNQKIEEVQSWKNRVSELQTENLRITQAFVNAQRLKVKAQIDYDALHARTAAAKPKQTRRTKKRGSSQSN